jgi:hypothetical protein
MVTSVRGLLELGRKLPENLQKQRGSIEQLYDQRKSIFENRSHRVENRIANLRQPFLRPIVRGKAKAPVEFGPKLQMSSTFFVSSVSRFCEGTVRTFF